MKPQFEHLTSPFNLGKIQLKNRFVAAPHGTHMASGGRIPQADLEHHIRLAEGGVGLIVSGGTIVHPSSSLRSRRLVEAYLDEVLPELIERANAVHQRGAALICQLFHLGRELIGGEMDSPPFAPSVIKTPRDPYPPHEMTVAEIDDVIEGFAKSAKNMQNSGHDGIEIHAAHGYLISQFLSKASNQRSDTFGGSLENRMRLLHLIIDAVRARCGSDFIIGVRLSAEEEIPGGLDLAQSSEIAISLAEGNGVERNRIDYLSVTHGTRGTYVKDASNPDGVAVKSASQLKKLSGLPMIVAQRIRDPFMAEEVIKNGHADLIGMTRALLADPDLPRKTIEGRSEEIRSCIGLNQDCRTLDPHLRCTINAEIGRPLTRALTRPADVVKKVTVIGGGPAGLEAARVAGHRGHKVTLFEKETSLGGQLRIASLAPFRSSIMDVVAFQIGELTRLRVDIHLGVEISSDDLRDIESDSDSVIMAIGSSPVTRLEIGHSRVKSVDEVLGGLDLSGISTAVVVDESDGFWPAYNAAEFLSRAGIQTSFVTPLAALATRLPLDSIPPLFARFTEFGVRCFPHHKVISVSSDSIEIAQQVSPSPSRLPADLLVWHSGRSVNSLAMNSIQDVDFAKWFTIGDCLTPRRLSHAISDGYRVGTQI